MKINILYKLKPGAWGGGNTFLNALKKEFLKMGVYEDDPDKADAILFNSFPFREEHFFKKIYEFKKAGKLIFHRVDGPISEIRNKDVYIDKIIYKFNYFFADGTIFQSDWSRKENMRLGMKGNIDTVIINASDPNVFNKEGKAPYGVSGKIKLIASSWSSNMRKGFDIYKYLDDNLDFNKYDMIYVGNSPCEFKNIKTLEPLPRPELAKILKDNDIFITASRKDPCSNSLIEALNCGLPVAALNDGGHPQVIGRGGVFFTGRDDVVEAIEKISENYEHYQKAILIINISEAALKYFNFIKETANSIKSGRILGKRLGLFSGPMFFLNYHILKVLKDRIYGR